MAASGDVTIAQDGGQAKLHPYLVALVRWCVSCLWSTATVLLHRLMEKQLPQITGAASKAVKPRPAGKEHLHPEPKVECVVLHEPETHSLDVIFVHGLYGSLGNTWRQGEWKTKYHVDPERIHLRRPTASPSPCSCLQCQIDNKNSSNNNKNIGNNLENNSNKNRFNNFENNVTIYDQETYATRFNTNDNNINNYDENAFTNIDENFYKNIKKILPQDDVFITEKFYNNTLLGQVEIIENYETQAKFVSDLFKNCDNGCEKTETHLIKSKNNNVQNENNNVQNENNNVQNENKNEQNENNNSEHCKCKKKCEAGCGCICDDCYSPCWPQDWIKVDYPEARVISINYTSDPHLWRPLWVKESKRLCLHERAEQMMAQLLDLGVGQRPVVWVGHSKGGLFIKQIYCEAYEAYLKTHPKEAEQMKKQINSETRQNHEMNNFKYIDSNHFSVTTEDIDNNEQNTNNNEQNNNDQNERTDDQNKDNNCERKTSNEEIKVYDENDTSTDLRIEMNENCDQNLLQSSNNEEDRAVLRSSLWSNSIGFMYYSVPHRGSSLADIKTPITARSVELIEISKDNSLVLSLQARWLAATATSRPLVRSLVETRRTLMSVLWLRIVSTDSADPGVGALCGVSVDHREICKPSGRRCLLYTELAELIRAALAKLRE